MVERNRVTDASARASQRSESSGVGMVRVHQHGADPGATPGQSRAGIKRVAAVVAAPDKYDDAGAVDRVEQLSTVDGQRSGRALHERTVG